MPIEWDDNLKTGVFAIDEQHQELLVMLNRFDRFRQGKKSFCEAFEELKKYMQVHFKTEEDFMKNANYSEMEEHKKCHDKFVEEIYKIEEKINQTENINCIGDELSKFATDWVIKHYSNEDVKLANYIKKSQIK